ncbi:MAG: hypothetical protein ACOX7U_05830 [Desulfitobacteriia bacterium]|jgi:hypothetical protein
MAVRKKPSIRYIITVLVATFLIAVLLSSGIETVLRLFPRALAWVLLIVVIGIGIVFDVIGVAVAVADEAPHHARAAKKVFGARQAVFLIRHADIVANFACDIIGDITGTLSGAIGATIAVSLVYDYPQLSNWGMFLNVLLLALIASCTVTGKARAKTFAINEANRIIKAAGKIIASFEKVTNLDFTRSKKGGK